MKNLKNIFKLGVFMLMAGTALQAQQITGTDSKLGDADYSAAAGTNLNKSIRVIDNKGTIKYLQVKNGLTMITNGTDGASGEKTTTTWQLGGELADNTYIDAQGQTFSLDGLSLVDGTNTAAAAAAITGSVGSNANSLGSSGVQDMANTGWTLLIRDESTGEISKMLASDLISGIGVVHTQSADAGADVPITVTGLPVLSAGSTMAKLFVYRNGVKLRSVTDFTTAVDEVTILYDANVLPMYMDDVIEIQYIK